MNNVTNFTKLHVTIIYKEGQKIKKLENLLTDKEIEKLNKDYLENEKIKFGNYLLKTEDINLIILPDISLEEFNKKFRNSELTKPEVKKYLGLNEAEAKEIYSRQLILQENLENIKKDIEKKKTN